MVYSLSTIVDMWSGTKIESEDSTLRRLEVYLYPPFGGKRVKVSLLVYRLVFDWLMRTREEEQGNERIKQFYKDVCEATNRVDLLGLFESIDLPYPAKDILPVSALKRVLLICVIPVSEGIIEIYRPTEQDPALIMDKIQQRARKCREEKKQRRERRKQLKLLNQQF